MHILRGQMTLSLTLEERKKIEELMDKYHMSQHAIVKACLRYVLFPEEREKIPVDGYVAAREVDGEIGFYEPRSVTFEKETEK